MDKSLVNILIVDDEEAILDALQTNLEMDGYHVETSTSGKDALLKIKKDTFHIVLTDINMPEMDGLELLEKIKTSSSEVIVIMITAYSSIMKVGSARSLGAYDYILKPFKDLQELDEVITRAYETIVRWERMLVETLKTKKRKPDE